MPTKFIPLAVALVFGTIAAVGFSKMMRAQPQTATVEIFVASRIINQSEEIAQDAIKLERWPTAVAPKDAISDWAKLKDHFASQRLLEGEPIVQRKLVSADEIQTGGIPRGYTVVALRADEENSLGNLIAPGDRVDVIGSFAKGQQFKETNIKTVLSGVRVWAVDGVTKRESLDEQQEKKTARTVSLLIHKEDTEPWMLAHELGKIRLSLGRPDDGVSAEDADSPNPAGQAFLQWLADYQDLKDPPYQQDSPQTAETYPLETEPDLPEMPKDTRPAVVHEMVRMGTNGQLSVYRWTEGNPIPTITTLDADAANTPDQPAYWNNANMNVDDLPGDGEQLDGGTGEQDDDFFNRKRKQPYVKRPIAR